MIFLNAFLIGGLICFIGQIIMELFGLTPGHLTSIFVIFGASLEFFDLYDKLIEIGGAGATLPITSFGHSMAHAAYEGALSNGFIGLSQNIFSTTANGIVYAILIATLFGSIFKPKG